MSAVQRLGADQRGVGLMEVMISIVIGMLLVLVIYQVYEVSEGQKRTITAAATPSRTRAMACSCSAATSPWPATASRPQARTSTGARSAPDSRADQAGATDNDPDTLTVFTAARTRCRRQSN
jgi:Tfp pilus assembly major pilin PilA